MVLKQILLLVFLVEFKSTSGCEYDSMSSECRTFCQSKRDPGKNGAFYTDCDTGNINAPYCLGSCGVCPRGCCEYITGKGQRILCPAVPEPVLTEAPVPPEPEEPRQSTQGFDDLTLGAIIGGGILLVLVFAVCLCCCCEYHRYPGWHYRRWRNPPPPPIEPVPVLGANSVAVVAPTQHIDLQPTQISIKKIKTGEYPFPVQSFAVVEQRLP